ncbi:hypothetical protein H5410_049564 [Solanum commersonii]|uniref:Uncharacterized protein n=1 Tax=Solanum commersonii TaxID=4109 RepID=A0A9J5WSZ1_SOLCO|nr:hypothetical protein H5410_049564 [Solanum commersonii]
MFLVPRICNVSHVREKKLLFHHGDLKFRKEVSTLFYHVAIGVIVDGASLSHEHQCFMGVRLDNDVLQVEVLRHGQPAVRHDVVTTPNYPMNPPNHLSLSSLAIPPYPANPEFCIKVSSVLILIYSDGGNDQLMYLGASLCLTCLTTD